MTTEASTLQVDGVDTPISWVALTSEGRSVLERHAVTRHFLSIEAERLKQRAQILNEDLAEIEVELSRKRRTIEMELQSIQTQLRATQASLATATNRLVVAQNEILEQAGVLEAERSQFVPEVGPDFTFTRLARSGPPKES